MRIAGRALVSGRAAGTALVLDGPLSLWGGLDAESGAIVDRRHPQLGMIVTGRVLVMPAGRGSSSASSVLAEAIRLGTAPAAVLLRDADAVLVIGALVGTGLYGRSCPIVVVDATEHAAIATGDTVVVETDGTVRVDRPAGSPSVPR
jgi:predicted aconitase with swiveling domain